MYDAQKEYFIYKNKRKNETLYRSNIDHLYIRLPLNDYDSTYIYQNYR